MNQIKDPPADTPADIPPDQSVTPTKNGGIGGWLKGLFRTKNGDSARDTLAELIEEREDEEIPINENERVLLANILELRDRTIADVMVPRVDIIAIETEASIKDVTKIMTENGHSRIPVYRETLDNAVGMVHIKDILAWDGPDEKFKLAQVIRKVLFVSPSMQVLELLLEMRANRSHMALVVDEFGGIDGLVTIEDLVEEIVGEIEDEHDQEEAPGLKALKDGCYTADARLLLKDMEEKFGVFLEEEEREYIDTLGGLVFALAGRVPIRGELIQHPSGFEFEVLDADPRRIRRLKIRAIPPQPDKADD